MQNIDIWLKEFRKLWINKEIEKMIELFSDDVIYFETPFKRLKNKNEIKEEWEAIKSQNKIGIDLELFSKENNRFTVKWVLRFVDIRNSIHESRGVYLISLNDENKCDLFIQYFQKE